MTVLLSLLLLLAIAGLIVATAMRARPGSLSQYELELRRSQLTGGVEGLVQAKRMVLIVLVFGVAVAAYGWGWAIVLTLAVILLHPALARLRPVEHIGSQLYARYETVLLRKAETVSWLVRLVGVEAQLPHLRVGSREELAHLIDQAGVHLTPGQRKLLLHSLTFETRTVGEVMTGRGDIATIDRRELLGPLVLDDLHKTGHSLFPVTDGDVDHVVGVLSITGFLSLDSKRSVTAEKAMTPHVERVRDGASLRSTLELFLRSHQHLLVVENGEGETVGVVTLHDIVTALFGR